VTVKLTAGAPGTTTGRLRPEAPAGWVVEPAVASFTLGGKGSQASVTFQVRPADGKAPGRSKPGPLRFVAEVGGGARLSRGVVRIVHEHIPIQTLLGDAQVTLVP